MKLESFHFSAQMISVGSRVVDAIRALPVEQALMVLEWVRTRILDAERKVVAK